MSESEIIRAERIEADAAPEPRRSLHAVAAEDHDEGGLTNPVSWRLHRDVPEPPDPWERGQIQCERCDEFHEPACAHGRQLCWDHAPLCCESCACEEADAAAIVEQRRQEWLA